MQIINRSAPSDPESLNNELVAARDQYNASLASILDRVSERRQSIAEIQRDLNAEDDALRNVAEGILQ